MRDDGVKQRQNCKKKHPPHATVGVTTAFQQGRKYLE